MREETNRTLVDSIADILYVPSLDAIYNLGQERIAFDKIVFVGNVMVDSWRWKFGWELPDKEKFGLVTMHRPQNVDDPVFMKKLMQVLENLDYPLVFPKHPRVTLPYVPENVALSGPLRYETFGKLLRRAKFVITDSGGLQEETMCTGTPCFTLRPNTERPVTITEGTNRLITICDLNECVKRAITGSCKQAPMPLYWDGNAAERISQHLASVSSSGL